MFSGNRAFTYGECIFKKVERLSSRGAEISKRQKAQVIYELSHDFKVSNLVKIAEIARSTYYCWVKQFTRPDKYKEIKEIIKQIFDEHKGRYGYRRITLKLKNRSYSINHKTVRRLMIELGLKFLVRMKKYCSYRGNVGRISPNVLQGVPPHAYQVKNGNKMNFRSYELKNS